MTCSWVLRAFSLWPLSERNFGCDRRDGVWGQGRLACYIRSRSSWAGRGNTPKERFTRAAKGSQTVAVEQVLGSTSTAHWADDSCKLRTPGGAMPKPEPDGLTPGRFPGELNAPQQNCLRVTCHYIDELPGNRAEVEKHLALLRTWSPEQNPISQLNGPNSKRGEGSCRNISTSR